MRIEPITQTSIGHPYFVPLAHITVGHRPLIVIITLEYLILTRGTYLHYPLRMPVLLGLGYHNLRLRSLAKGVAAIC